VKGLTHGGEDALAGLAGVGPSEDGRAESGAADRGEHRYWMRSKEERGLRMGVGRLQEGGPSCDGPFRRGRWAAGRPR
jgi:hypothetical protein